MLLRGRTGLETWRFVEKIGFVWKDTGVQIICGRRKIIFKLWEETPSLELFGKDGKVVMEVKV